MASKMKKTKKQRAHKTSSKAAKERRIVVQLEQTNANKTRVRQGGQKVWDQVCSKRTASRIAQGKPQMWGKKQAEVSMYKAKGKNKVA